MYPTPDTRHFEFPPVSTVMEGAKRPGHFNGVCQVVSRLFFIVHPTRAYFGEKDWQQIAVIKQLVKYLNSDVQIVESKFITYFTADNSKKAGAVSFDNDDVINRTGGNSVNEYVGREDVASDVILPVWEKELYPRGWVSTPTLDELRAKELVKYSPIKQLTAEQGQLITEIINNPNKNYVINGDAGTGKTVLLTHLAASIVRMRQWIMTGSLSLRNHIVQISFNQMKTRS